MSEMFASIGGLGDQLRWAADLPLLHPGTTSEVLYAGMGGSGVAGDYARTIAEPYGTRVTVHKGYGPIPPWAIRQRPLVVAASYSGNTEEILEVALSSHESGLQVAAITTGGALAAMASERDWPTILLPAGLQPRAAAGYGIGAVIRLLEGAYALDDQRFAFIEAADLLDRMVEEDGETWTTAEGIATALSGRIPIIYGGGPVSSTVATRWKTQINENAKIPSWASSLPELDHNEIQGWEAMPDLTRQHVGIVALTDQGDHDRIRARLNHTAALTESAVPWVAEVASEGRSLLARLMSLTVVGDLVSVMLARNVGVDAVPVATLEELKKRLAKENS